MRWLALWTPVFAWAGLIFFFSGVASLDSGLEADFILRKAAHVTEYAVFTALLWRAARGTWPIAPWALRLCVVCAAFFYAVSDEWHQSFVPGRRGAWQDVMIDSLGIVLCMVILWQLERCRNK